MTFSIVVPVFKTEHLLKRCLDSFATQTDGDFEVIVVDDCSPGEAGRSGIAPYRAEANPAVAGRPPYQAVVGADLRAARTWAQEIVSQYDARFKYVRHEKNLSLFQARQTGLRMAQGEYVVPFDSDDYALPRLLEELRKVIGGERRWRRTKDDRSDKRQLQNLRFRLGGPRSVAAADGTEPVPPEVLQLPHKSDEDVASPVASQSNNPTIQQSNNSPDVIVYQMTYDNGRKITKPSVRYKNERLTGAEALDRFFASKIQCAICGKAVRREVYLKAMDQLAAPRDFYLNSSEDLCQTFPVLMNAQLVATISYPGYRYWLNNDSLTTTLTDPAKLGKAAENTARVFDMLAGFVRRTQCVGQDGCGEKMPARLEGLMRPTLRWYLSCLRHLPEAEWRACVSKLNRHFAPDLVAREAMLLVEESATHRLGRLMTLPLRWMRS